MLWDRGQGTTLKDAVKDEEMSWVWQGSPRTGGSPRLSHGSGLRREDRGGEGLRPAGMLGVGPELICSHSGAWSEAVGSAGHGSEGPSRLPDSRTRNERRNGECGGGSKTIKSESFVRFS